MPRIEVALWWIAIPIIGSIIIWGLVLGKQGTAGLDARPTAGARVFLVANALGCLVWIGLAIGNFWDQRVDPTWRFVDLAGGLACFCLYLWILRRRKPAP